MVSCGVVSHVKIAPCLSLAAVFAFAGFAATPAAVPLVPVACDALDPVKDGVLEDPARCRFDLAALACTGGDRPDCWVESGVRPASIVASHLTGGVADRTRPLCAYPATARYTGGGSTDDARNFRCEAP